MSALAKYLYGCGKKVSGSDITSGIFTDELKEIGIKVDIGNVNADISQFQVVVYTDAVREDDALLIEAHKLNKIVFSRGQLLYEISRDFSQVVAVSGCHGKTTCTAMMAHIVAAADIGFCAHIGGRDLKFGNFYNCGREVFITEACEYKKNFLLLKPDIAIVLNSRPDHLECYGNAESLKYAYKQFADSSDVSICLYGDVCEHSISFGFDKNADYSARNIAETEGFYSFTAYEGDCELGRVKLGIYGKHNILNALAAIAAARSLKISFRTICDGLNDFKGVERRFEKIGEIKGSAWIADYAHHPDEIRATLRAAKKMTAGKIYVVFQPHTYSRTKNLFKQFVRVLAQQNNLLIYRTYAAREYYDDAGSALTLSQAIKKSRYGDSARDIMDFAFKAGDGDTVLFLGAGDIYDIAKDIVKKLSLRS